MRPSFLRSALLPALAFAAIACGGGTGGSLPSNPSGAGVDAASDAPPDALGPTPAPTSSGSSSGSLGATGQPPDAGTGLDMAVDAALPDAGAPSGLDADVVDALGRDAGQPPVTGPDASVNVANLPNVTLFVAGDSTASTYGPASAQQGWGEHLVNFLLGKVTVDDQALPGSTVKSFSGSGRWSSIQSALKAGDFVMIEFGINDSSTAAGRFVAVPEFTTLIGTMVDTVLAQHATPILVTPTALQYWTNGVETNAREQPYADAMKLVAAQKHVLVDDLNARSVEYLNVIGQTAAAQVYINGDKAHFTLQGATQMAKLATQELVRIGSPLGPYVK